MATGKGVREIVAAGYGTRHAWTVSNPCFSAEGHAQADLRVLRHYGTELLLWDHETKAVIRFDRGWGSVSDQTGLNAAFETLGAPYRYSRAKGGAFWYWPGADKQVEVVL